MKYKIKMDGVTDSQCKRIRRIYYGMLDYITPDEAPRLIQSLLQAQAWANASEHINTTAL